MSNALSIAVNGIDQAVSRATQSAANIVNASSTGKNIDEDLVNLKSASIDLASSAKVVQTEEKIQKALLDITV